MSKKVRFGLIMLLTLVLAALFACSALAEGLEQVSEEIEQEEVELETTHKKRSKGDEPQTYTITWQDDAGTVIDTTTVEADEIPTHADATKEATAEYSYTFAGWDPTPVPATGDATYRATFTSSKRSYTITWLDDAGATIDTTTVEYGETPTHADATKEATAEYSYTFAGWTPAIAQVTGEASYTATFTSAKRSYTITWQDDAGTTIDTSTLEYGATPTHADPAKAETAEYTYTFAGWTPAIAAVAGDATYTATFTPVKRSYAITWQDEAGATVETTTVEYGVVPTHDPLTKEQTAEYTYTFEWDPAPVAVVGDATYKAKFTPVKRSYTITWLDDAGATIDTTTVEYGATPTHADPAKAATAEYIYTFAGWTPAIAAVTGDATYTATFAPTKRTYTVAWVNYDGTLLETDANVEYGATPTYDGATPVHAEDGVNTYAFKEWRTADGQAVAPVAGDVTYIATYTETPIIYITKVSALSDLNITYKPTAKAALKLLPAKAEATLSDGNKAEATLVWTEASAPADYAKKTGDGTYTFTVASVTTAASNPMAPDLKMPTCNLVVGPAKYSDDHATYTYRVSETGEVTVTLVEPKKNTTELTVPERFGEGLPVLHIGKEAFKDLDKITAIVLPKGLLSIGDRAFAGCVALEAVTLPDSLQSVGKQMFKDVAALTKVTLIADLESVLSADTTVIHSLLEDKKNEEYVVEMPVAFTDIVVNSTAFTVDCDYTVAAEHAVTLNPGAIMTVAETRTLKNLGTVANNGEVDNAGTIITCGGVWTGNDPVAQETGTLITTHVYEKGVCTGCGAQEEIIVTQLTISYTGSGLDKIYDKTRNVTVTGSDFRISGTRSDHTAVRISGIRAAYDSPDVGDRRVTIGFTLGGDDAAWYTCNDITVNAKITPKALIITPNEGQQKFYGAADPTYFTGTVKGLLQGDSITGRLARESGEDVGKYKILQGTIDAGTNYEVQVQEAYFMIEAKSINSTDVGLVTIGNQKYTGQAIKPTITLRYGTLTLRQDTDFKAEYTDNVKVGTAKVKLTGIGNYTGERETSFRILDVDGGGSGGGSGGSGGGDDFDTGSDEFEDEDEEEEDEDTGRLMLDDVDYGDVLMTLDGDPQPFTLSDDTNELGQRVLTIMPDPMMDGTTGESLYLDDDNMRERYNEAHLRMSATLAQTLAEKGISEIVYQLDQADVHIPLSSLVAELPLDAPDAPNAGETADGADETEVAPQALQVASYDICLEQADAIRLTNAEKRAALIAEGVDVPEVDAAETVDMTDDNGPVTQLDPRVSALLLSERELKQLDAFPQLMIPAYRVRVRVILEGQEPEVTGLKDDNGEPLPQMIPKALPEGVYPKDIRMVLTPDEVPQETPEEAVAIRAAVLNSPWDMNRVDFENAAFEETEGMLSAVLPLNRDGVYAVRLPEAPADEAEEDYADDGFEEDEDEEGYVEF